MYLSYRVCLLYMRFYSITLRTIFDFSNWLMQDHYLELIDKASQTQEGDNEPHIVDKADIFYQTMGGQRKHWVYRVGSQASIFNPQISQSSSTGTSSKEL